MKSYRDTLKMLNRPKILVRAAQSGMAFYRRDILFQQIPSLAARTTTENLVEQLFAREDTLNRQRVDNDIDYDVRKHILILTALLMETSHLANHQVIEVKAAA